MKIPVKLIKSQSQITVSILALMLYFLCSLFFNNDTIVSNRWIPFVGGVLLALLAQEADWANYKSASLMTLVNGFIIFVTAFGLSFVAPKVEKNITLLAMIPIEKFSSTGIQSEHAAINNKYDNNTVLKNWSQ